MRIAGLGLTPSSPFNNMRTRTTLMIEKAFGFWAIALVATGSMIVVDSALAAAAPVRVASYGANGTHWPSLIPTPFLYDDTVPNIINVTCTWRAISNAIISVTPAQAAAGVLIRVAPGTLTGNGAGAGNAAVLKNLGSSSWSQRVTVCPRDGYGTVIFSGGVRLVNVRGVCFAGLNGDSIKLEGCDNSALAWTKVAAWLAGYGLAGQATAGVEYCEVVIPDSWVHDGDASDFYAVDNGPLTNWVFEACYLAPRFFNPATTPKPHTDSLQFAGSCASITMRDVAIFASNNCSLQTGSIAHLILIHSYIVAGSVARSRYPFLPGGATEGGTAAFNGGGVNFSGTDSVFIGAMGSTTWAYVSNTRTSYAYATSQQPATGSWTVDTSLSATNPPMPPYPTDSYLDAIWSNPGEMISNVPPAITSSPQNALVPQGSNVTFAVTASGSPPLSCQWRLNGQPLAGATATNCAVTCVQCTNVGCYDVIVTNSGGSVTSSVAILAVVSSPVFVAHPTDQTVTVGQPLILSCGATNDCGGGLAYQWRSNNADLLDATNRTWFCPNAQSADSGSYTVVVTNLAGAVTSSVAVLEVTSSWLALTPPGLDFGTVFCGLTTCASFVVSNAGVGRLSGTATILGGPFTLAPGKGGGLAIPVLGSTNLVVQFTPPAAGVFSNVIVFATDGGSTTNSLYGVGADLPLLLWAVEAGASAVFHFPTVAGKNYTLEYQDSLENRAWLPLQSLVGDGGTNSFTNSSVTASQRFYRLSAR